MNQALSGDSVVRVARLACTTKYADVANLFLGELFTSSRACEVCACAAELEQSRLRDEQSALCEALASDALGGNVEAASIRNVLGRIARVDEPSAHQLNERLLSAFIHQKADNLLPTIRSQFGETMPNGWIWPIEDCPYFDLRPEMPTIAN